MLSGRRCIQGKHNFAQEHKDDDYSNIRKWYFLMVYLLKLLNLVLKLFINLRRNSESFAKVTLLMVIKQCIKHGRRN